MLTNQIVPDKIQFIKRNHPLNKNPHRHSKQSGWVYTTKGSVSGRIITKSICSKKQIPVIKTELVQKQEVQSNGKSTGCISSI